MVEERQWPSFFRAGPCGQWPILDVVEAVKQNQSLIREQKEADLTKKASEVGDCFIKTTTKNKKKKDPTILWSIFGTLQWGFISSLAALRVRLFHMTSVIICELCKKVKLHVISSAQCLLIRCVIRVWTPSPPCVIIPQSQACGKKPKKKEKEGVKYWPRLAFNDIKQKFSDTSEGTWRLFRPPDSFFTASSTYQLLREASALAPAGNTNTLSEVNGTFETSFSFYLFLNSASSALSTNCMSPQFLALLKSCSGVLKALPRKNNRRKTTLQKSRCSAGITCSVGAATLSANLSNYFKQEDFQLEHSYPWEKCS